MRKTLGVSFSAVLGLLAGVAGAQMPPPESAPPPAQATPAAPPPQGGEAAPGAQTPAAPPPIEEKAVPPPPAKPEEQATPERFKQVLSPHGRWTQTPEYGEVWVPNVSPGWRPYTHGRWVYTRHGWTFVSYDPWGWAPFHYGRWAYYPPAGGWAWIPGYQWAPAWVSWRYGPSYVAWAPLGPPGVADTYYNTPSLWLAVRGPYFYRPLRPGYFVPTARVSVVFGATRFYGVPLRAGVYYSPPVRYISRVVGRPVVRVSARRVAPRWVARGVYRPQVRLRNAFSRARGRVVARPGRGFARGRGWGAPGRWRGPRPGRGRGLGPPPKRGGVFRARPGGGRGPRGGPPRRRR
jgi:hypothetical protein